MVRGVGEVFVQRADEESVVYKIKITPEIEQEITRRMLEFDPLIRAQGGNVRQVKLAAMLADCLLHLHCEILIYGGTATTATTSEVGDSNILSLDPSEVNLVGLLEKANLLGHAHRFLNAGFDWVTPFQAVLGVERSTFKEMGVASVGPWKRWRKAIFELGGEVVRRDKRLAGNRVGEQYLDLFERFTQQNQDETMAAWSYGAARAPALPEPRGRMR